jgi:predicted Zn-dependent protease
MKVLQVEYFDGKDSRKHPASLVIAGDKVKLVGRDVVGTFDAKRVRRSLRIANIPRWLYLPGGGACVTTDHETVDRLIKPRRYDRLLQDWESRPALAGIAVVLVFAAAAALIFYGVPAAVEQVALRIPVQAEAPLGTRTLQGMDGFGLTPTRLPQGRQEQLRQKFSAMAARAGDKTPYRLEFRSSTALGPNAFALPSGIIVVMDDLVRISGSDDEVLGVLGHELGHVHYRHTMRRLLEGSATALVIAGLTGDIASTTSLAASAPALLLQTKYSRDNEHEADLYAIDIMRRGGVDPEHYADMFTRLESASKQHVGIPTFLSTHPASKERKLLAQAASTHEATATEQDLGASEYRKALTLIQEYNGSGNELQLASAIAKSLRKSDPKSGYAQTLEAEMASTWELGENAENRDAFGTALRLSGEALLLNPDLPEAHVARARTLLRSRSFDEANKDIDAALSAAPKLSSAIFLRADFYRRTGDVANAETWYLKFIDTEESPQRKSNGYYWLGRAYRDAGAATDPAKQMELWTKTKGYYQKMVELDPHSPYKYVNFAAFLNNEMGDFDAAEQYAQRALGEMDFPQARLHIAYARYQKLFATSDGMSDQDVRQASLKITQATGINLQQALQSAACCAGIQARLARLQNRALPVNRGTVTAGPDGTTRYPLPDRSNLQFSLPAGWVQEFAQPERGPATITLRSRESGQFLVAVTPVVQTEGSPKITVEDIKRNLQYTITAMKARALEHDIPMHQISGTDGPGFYYSMTDKAPRPGEYKYLTQGVLKVGNAFLNFSILSNDANSTAVQDSLEMLQRVKRSPT